MKNRLGRVDKAFHIEYIERKIPLLKGKQVLLKIKASCICGSDLHIFKDKHPTVELPVTIGHEFTGEVLDIGGEVTRLKKGNRVVIEPAITCGKCEACMHGNYGYCEKITFTYRLGDGAMATYFIGEEDRMYLLPDKVSYEEGSLIEPLAVAVHAVKRAGVHLGEQVVVIGAGAIGIMIAAICRRLGAKEVIIADLSEFRLRMAERLGATKTVCSTSDDLGAVVDKITKGKGADQVFECVGLEKTFQQALALVRSNGLVTDVGIFENPQIMIDASILVKKEIRIQGSQGYCWDFKDALQLLQEIPFGQLITHSFGLSELQTAMETAINPECNVVKICIKP